MIDTQLRLIGKCNAKKYGERIKVEEGPTVEDATDEQILYEIRREFQQMVAQGFDVAGVLREAGVEL